MQSIIKSVLVGSTLGVFCATAALPQVNDDRLSANILRNGDPVTGTSSYIDGECPNDQEFLKQLRQKALDEIDEKIDFRRKKCEYHVGVLSVANYDIKFISNGRNGCRYMITSTTACLTNP